ncbi:MAG: hypothetical protein IPH18_12175 [Chitinophagaceae bacterium]|nr:hypothetical protein [Chitinophagaceae bacterium]
MSRMYGFGKIARLVAAAGILLLFTSYGNKKVHPGLNGYMLDKFMTRCKNQGFAGSRFEHYGFYFKEWGKIRGTAITKNGLFSPGDVAAAGVVGDIGAIVDKNVVSAVYSDEGTMEMTPREWITDGGFAADVPEVPASLRHFYDPTRPAGSRYLTDITNARIMGAIQKYALTNPRMDGLDWALGKPGDKANSAQDHQYTWEKGKNWIRMALQEPDKDKRNELMAAAWRSLGETLHMIADHGCPPHVRDDAHPSPLWGNNNLFGNPDPYEEYMDIIRNKEPQLFSTFANGQANQGLAAKISSAKTARDVAHALAEFTNAGFVTNETIAGTDQYGNNRIPVTHPGYTYPAPLLEQMSYNASDYTYYSASGVKQCTDHYYFAKMIPRYVPPFVDYNCVVSQAGVLVPNLIEAGSHVIKLYIPQLAIQWQREANGRIRGEVVHTTDAEYTNAIAYTGPVLI